MTSGAGPRESSLLGLSASGFHKIAYVEWGDPEADRTAVCVHGLTRNGRDFDRLAVSLAEAGWRVVCPDVVGRGRSDWLADPTGYGMPQYMADMNALVARLDCARVDWVGTSMGGLIGMMLAAQEANPIDRLVINDVGPLVPAAALARIAEYLGKAPVFERLEDLEGYLRQVHAPFGPLSDDDWAHLARHSARKTEGGFELAYDRRLGDVFIEPPFEDIDLWQVWDKVSCPTLVLRGVDSDLLLAETVEEMRSRGPRAEVATIESCGHAPALMNESQTSLVVDWLSDRGSSTAA